eukprot:m.70711 g.70711  ORF g.70711 m.70711 type:complete len:316 (+) comp35701_c0_seq1:2-949(+)
MRLPVLLFCLLPATLHGCRNDEFCDTGENSTQFRTLPNITENSAFVATVLVTDVNPDAETGKVEVSCLLLQKTTRTIPDGKFAVQGFNRSSIPCGCLSKEYQHFRPVMFFKESKNGFSLLFESTFSEEQVRYILELTKPKQGKCLKVGEVFQVAQARGSIGGTRCSSASVGDSWYLVAAQCAHFREVELAVGSSEGVKPTRKEILINKKNNGGLVLLKANLNRFVRRFDFGPYIPTNSSDCNAIYPSENVTSVRCTKMEKRIKCYGLKESPDLPVLVCHGRLVGLGLFKGGRVHFAPITAKRQKVITRIVHAESD